MCISTPSGTVLTPPGAIKLFCYYLVSPSVPSRGRFTPFGADLPPGVCQPPFAPARENGAVGGAGVEVRVQGRS